MERESELTMSGEARAQLRLLNRENREMRYYFSSLINACVLHFACEKEAADSLSEASTPEEFDSIVRGDKLELAHRTKRALQEALRRAMLHYPRDPSNRKGNDCECEES